jgi:hypothetical protein
MDSEWLGWRHARWSGMMEVKERDPIGFDGWIQRAMVGESGRCFGTAGGQGTCHGWSHSFPIYSISIGERSSTNDVYLISYQFRSRESIVYRLCTVSVPFSVRVTSSGLTSLPASHLWPSHRDSSSSSPSSTYLSITLRSTDSLTPRLFNRLTQSG